MMTSMLVRWSAVAKRLEKLQTLAKRYGVQTIAKGMLIDNDAYTSPSMSLPK